MQIRLKAATNIDLKLLNAILSSKFAAKIGAEGENMKTRLKNAGGSIEAKIL
jgi:hypothetical protein